MKRFSIGIIFMLVFAFVLDFQTSAFAQGGRVQPSLKASVSQTLGADTEVTIGYSRPGVKERKIWGELVPYGLAPGNQYSKDKPCPWRAGANENTTIEFSKDVLINGKKLAAGKYSIHMIPAKTDWIVIFNTKNDAWGSYSYNKAEDALRVTVKPVKAPHQEWLLFGFEKLDGNSATAFLHWEMLKVPFQIKLAN